MNFGKTLELTSDQLKKLNLKYGKNEIRYEVFTMLQEIFEFLRIVSPMSFLHLTGQSISLIGKVPIEILPGKRHIT